MILLYISEVPNLQLFIISFRKPLKKEIKNQSNWSYIRGCITHLKVINSFKSFILTLK